MNKKIVLLALVLIFTATSSICATKSKTATQSSKETTIDTTTNYYPKANIQDAISRYKRGDYTGCLQETFSLIQKNDKNVAAYYYMGLAYSNIGKKDEAITAFEKVIELSPNSSVASYAQSGKDCLEDEKACRGYVAEDKSNGQLSEEDELDKFINAPYGNGLSPELDRELKQKKLNNFKNSINSKDNLEDNDIYRIRKFDIQSKTDEIEDNVKIAQVSDEEVLSAIKTLKDAGLTITVSDSNAQNNNNMMNMYANGYTDPEMAQMSMMLGNNNNNGSMMNMMPVMMMMQNEKEGKNIDPQLMQAMMMNSMITDFTFNTNDNNRY